MFWWQFPPTVFAIVKNFGGDEESSFLLIRIHSDSDSGHHSKVLKALSKIAEIPICKSKFISLSRICFVLYWVLNTGSLPQTAYPSSLQKQFYFLFLRQGLAALLNCSDKNWTCNLPTLVFQMLGLIQVKLRFSFLSFYFLLYPLPLRLILWIFFYKFHIPAWLSYMWVWAEMRKKRTDREDGVEEKEKWGEKEKEIVTFHLVI